MRNWCLQLRNLHPLQTRPWLSRFLDPTERLRFAPKCSTNPTLLNGSDARFGLLAFSWALKTAHSRTQRLKQVALLYSMNSQRAGGEMRISHRRDSTRFPPYAAQAAVPPKAVLTTHRAAGNERRPPPRPRCTKCRSAASLTLLEEKELQTIGLIDIFGG